MISVKPVQNASVITDNEELPSSLAAPNRDPENLPGPAEEISLLDLVIVIATRWRLICGMMIGAAMVGLLLGLVLPSSYTATTSILPPQQGNTTGSALMAQLGNLGSVTSLASGGLGLKNPNDLQVAMLKSRTVEDAMLKRFDLVKLYHKKRISDARKKLEKVIDIDSGSKDGLIRVSVTDYNPEQAATLANSYIEEFKTFSATLAVTEASQRRQFFERQLSQAKDNLANAEEELKTTEQKTGLIQLDSQTRGIVASVAQLQAQIAAKEVQITAMRSFATDENPELNMAEQELNGLQAQERKLGASGGDSSGLMIPRGALQGLQIEYVRKLRDVKYFETIFDLLARQFEAAKVDEARQGAIVQVVDRAVVPDRSSSPGLIIYVPGGAALGLFLGILWALSTEAYARLLHNPVEGPRLEQLRQVFLSRSKHQALG